MAFKYFLDMDVDIAVIEVGLGGRLDCTNIITPIISVITNISFDHTQFLGDTLAEIALEKAGIIKKGVPVVIGEATSETRPVFEHKAEENNAPIIFAEDNPEVVSADMLPSGGMHYKTRRMGEFDGDLGGLYQSKNMNTILTVFHILAVNGYLSYSETEKSIEKSQYELHEAMRMVGKKTGLMGRWQTIQTCPMVVCDTGHNVGGWEYLSKQLEMVKCQQLHIVFGMVNDKDIKGVMNLLPKKAVFYFTKPQSSRALNEKTVQILAAGHNLKGTSYPTVQEAYKAAKEAASIDDFIFIGGSSYLVGDFLKTCI